MLEIEIENGQLVAEPEPYLENTPSPDCTARFEANADLKEGVSGRMQMDIEENDKGRPE